MAIASLVLGIVCFLFAFIPVINFIAPLLGIIGIILGAISLKQAKDSGEPNGMALAGLITSVVTTIISIIIWLACAACMTGMNKEAQKYQKDPKSLEKTLKQLDQLGKELDKKQR